MSQEVISIQSLSKVYIMGNQRLEALKSVSLAINRNEYVALMGPSGSGKSTLMNILGCLDSPTAGTYYLNSINVSQMEDNDLAQVRNKEIGFIFQTFNLLPVLSAEENVRRHRTTKKTEKASEALRKVGLTDRMTHKPNELSGGQRQRVAIARAIVNDPAIILADEPTGNLDTKTSLEIMNIFETMHQAGNTIILVTHEPDIAEYAHRIVRLRDGSIESDIINENPVIQGVVI